MDLYNLDTWRTRKSGGQREPKHTGENRTLRTWKPEEHKRLENLGTRRT